MIRIGVDPDIDKSGYALLVDGKIIKLCCLSFFDLCERLLIYKNKTSGLMVTIEAGWLSRKSNWHPAMGRNVRERIAKNVGENHATGRLISTWCREKKIPYELIAPKGKIDSRRFQEVTGWTGRTNQEKRDAAMLVWGRQ